MDISTLEKFLSDSVPLRKTKDQKYLRKDNLRDWLFCGCIEQRHGPGRHFRVTTTEIVRQAVEELLYIFGSAWRMKTQVV
ncbi:hypothetical protein Bca4012_069440 [Brassica carinata]